MAASGVARRYARAVFDIAREEHDLDGWLRDLRVIRDVLQGTNLNALLENPGVSFEEKRHIVENTPLGRLGAKRRNFVLLLVENRRTGLIDDILSDYGSELNAARGVVIAKVTTAVPLDGEEIATVKRRLEVITHQKVIVNLAVDPAIIGGFIARIGDRLIDASVVGRLSALRASLMA
ncbi:MAG: ATP synthase F1 subunit delta [Chloroflexota bacterium]